MLRANVYTSEELGPHKRQAIHDGFAILGQYVGGITVSEKRVRLPTDNDGLVRHSKVGLSRLDLRVPIHLFAVPLFQDTVGIGGGVAYLGRGVGFIDTRPSRPNMITGSVAHEAAHTIGFVDPNSPQSRRNDSAHCGCKTCIMWPEVITGIDGMSDGVFRALKGSSLQEMRAATGLSPQEISERLVTPEAFCTPCVADMRDLHEEKVDSMMLNRMLAGEMVTKLEIAASRF